MLLRPTHATLHLQSKDFGCTERIREIGGSPRRLGPRARGKRHGDGAASHPSPSNRRQQRWEGRPGRGRPSDGNEAVRCTVTFNPNARMDRRQPRRGTRPRKDRPTNALNKRAPVQTVLRSKASGDRFPADTTGVMTLATAAARGSRIDGEAKSEEARMRGDAHRLQERRVLRGV